MLKCTDWNICNILQFSYSVNIHFKQPYWNGTIWKPYFMCQRGDLPEYWVFCWIDVPKHPGFFYGCFLHQKEFCSGWKIMFPKEKGPLNSPVEVDACWSGLHFHGRTTTEAAAFGKPSGFSPIAEKNVNLKVYNWVLQTILYVVLMKITCLLHESRPVDIQKEKWS